jgi:hypothetical protein
MSNEERYQIEGEVTYHRPSYDFIRYPNTNDIVRDFILTVNGRNWAIHLTGPQLEAGGIKYLEVVCLNGSVYSYWYSGKPGENSGGAVIEYGDFPVEDGTFANIVGIGLASASYLASATNANLVSLLSQPLYSKTREVKATWQLIDAPPYLPKSIDYYAGPGPRSPPFDDGYKEAQVRVLEETNVGNKTFPLIFTCELFEPKSGAVTSNDLDAAAICTIRVHSIKLNSVPNVLPPRTEGTTLVGEARFPNNTRDKQIVYFSTLDRLPEKPEAAAIKEYEQEQKRSALPSIAVRRQLKSEQPANHKWIWFSGVLIISVIVVIAGLIKKKA